MYLYIPFCHFQGIIISSMASKKNSVLVVYLIVCSGADQRKHQSSMSLAFVKGIHCWLVNSPHNGPVMWKMFPFDDVIMKIRTVHKRSVFHWIPSILQMPTHLSCCQYHGCWWPSDARSQGNSSHDIDLVFLVWSRPGMTRVNKAATRHYVTHYVPWHDTCHLYPFY